MIGERVLLSKTLKALYYLFLKELLLQFFTSPKFYILLVTVFQWSEESNDGNRCRPTSATFEFYLTDVTERKLESCNVIRCAMSLLYAPDENDRGFQGARVTDIVERTSSEAFVPVRGLSHSQVGERRNGIIRDEIPL